MAKELWVEKWRPSSVDGYVFRDENQRKQINAWITDGGIPHILLSGGPGIGKTTLGKILLNELGVHSSDILFMNGSDYTGVDDVRDKIKAFISVMPYGDFRYVFIDEAEYLSHNAQAALRSMTETFSNSARFILTCNNPGKIIPALHSRFQQFQFTHLDKDEFTKRILTILLEEGVQVDDLDVLDSFIVASYPDMRKCINTLQQSVADGILEPISKNDVSGTEDYLVAAIDMFKKGKYPEARALICKHAQPEDYEGLFTFAYQNLDLWATDVDRQGEVIVVIRDAMAKAPLCADPEINVACMFVELEMVANSK